MSVREEERRQKNCPNRGLGIAATAIGVGVGVGAALYYFFNKRSETPDSEGSTSGWQSHTLTEAEQITMLRDQAFRERSWALEECSICFDSMLQTQEVMELACTHRFHQACILPWLQEQQTCPNCRKLAGCKVPALY